MRSGTNSSKIVSVFLLDNGKSYFGKDKAEQNAKSDAILEKLGLSKESKLFVTKNEELLEVNIHDVDGFVIFPYSSQRFSSLIYLSETKLPIIIFSEEETFCSALETYEYLADHANVEIAFLQKEFKKKIKAVQTVKYLKKLKVCLFDADEWKLNSVAWLKNPVTSGKLNTQNIDYARFLEAYKNADRTKAEKLAKKWMDEAEKVLEPSFEDVVKSARVYLAMKTVIEEMKADAAYVLWCGQFTKELETKMCFALAKLADDGVPVGCWRGENLLPLLILHSTSKKPVFACEIFTRQNSVITLRHCFVPSTIAPCKYILRRWRSMKGTVTGYCQLPKGNVTLVNCGISDRAVIVKGKVIDCRDLGGENCRITVWVEVADEGSIQKFVGRECAMVYGDYVKEAKEIVQQLKLQCCE